MTTIPSSIMATLNAKPATVGFAAFVVSRFMLGGKYQIPSIAMPPCRRLSEKPPVCTVPVSGAR